MHHHQPAGLRGQWVNGPAVQTKGIGEPWSHATPGYVTVRVGAATADAAAPAPLLAPPPGEVQVCVEGGGGPCIDRDHHSSPNPDQMLLYKQTGVTEWKDQVWRFDGGRMRSACTNPACTGLQCVGTLADGRVGLVGCGNASALALTAVAAGNGSFRIVQQSPQRATAGQGGRSRAQRCLAVAHCDFAQGKPSPFAMEACGTSGTCHGRNQLWSIGPPHAPPAPAPPPPAPPARAFSASQELANARLNATTALESGMTLTASTFVAADKNLAVTRLRLSGGDQAPVAATFTLSTPNTWQIPTAAGSKGGRAWLRKDAVSTVDNALTLAACSPGALAYNGLRNFSDGAGDAGIRAWNATGGSFLCLHRMEPAGSTHTAVETLGPDDGWVTARPCGSSASAASSKAKWTLTSDGKLTDGEGHCVLYGTAAGCGATKSCQWSVKVTAQECTAAVPLGMHSEWEATVEDDGSGRLRATHAEVSDAEFAGGACLTASAPNVNVSIALAVALVDAQGERLDAAVNCTDAAPAEAAAGGQSATTSACTLSTELTPQQDYHLLVASMTQRDTDWSSEAVAAALALLRDVDVAKEEAAKDKFWREFWSKSQLDLMTGSSELHDLEAWYYG